MAKQGKCDACSTRYLWTTDVPLSRALCPRCGAALTRTSRGMRSYPTCTLYVPRIFPQSALPRTKMLPGLKVWTVDSVIEVLSYATPAERRMVTKELLRAAPRAYETQTLLPGIWTQLTAAAREAINIAFRRELGPAMSDAYRAEPLGEAPDSVDLAERALGGE